ncbi:hypothetical protein B0H17DRAFT_844209, partial [Mycena rosella]
PGAAVKLLGVHINRELRWKDQDAPVVAKGHSWLAQFAWLARASRAIRAKNMRRLYLGIAVSRMLYAAAVFLKAPGHSILSQGKQREKAVVKKLHTIQQRAALAITGVLPSTPTELLDVFANLLLVEHFIKKVRYGAATWIATLPKSHPL